MFLRGTPVVLVAAVSFWFAPGQPGKKNDPPPPQHLETFVNSIGMRLALIPAGDFVMGSPETDKDAQPDEKPQHKVRISKIFGMSLTTVTVGEFRQFARDTKYQTAAEQQGSAWRAVRADGKFIEGTKCDWQNPGFPVTDDHPAVNLDFEDALEFCKWLSKKEGQTYRLPTEAEWEYVCRAGTTTRWSCGDDAHDLEEYANIRYDVYPKYARANGPTARRFGWSFFAPVAQFKPNPWGLYDMHGNLWQWTSDWYSEDYYKKSPVENPTGPKEGSLHVIRGGTWSRGPQDCRSANRFGLSAATSMFVSFRVACERPAKE